jgi:hypothetical protein
LESLVGTCVTTIMLLDVLMEPKRIGYEKGVISFAQQETANDVVVLREEDHPYQRKMLLRMGQCGNTVDGVLSLHSRLLLATNPQNERRRPATRKSHGTRTLPSRREALEL